MNSAATSPGAWGHVIFVNGIQSAGKSSLAAEIKSRTSTFRVLTGDDVIRQVPYEQRAAQAGQLFVRTLNTIESWLESTNVIVDGAWNERQVITAKRRFGDAGLYVLLRIDESERKKRESSRKDRRLGHAWDPAWHDMPGPDEIYDVIIDSKVRNVAECADIVLSNARHSWDDVLLQ